MPARRRLEVSGGQTNVVTRTDPDSDILIGPEGLSGAMTSLQLAAGRLRIDGPVLNENTSPFADIALVAGNAELTHDSNVHSRHDDVSLCHPHGFARRRQHRAGRRHPARFADGEPGVGCRLGRRCRCIFRRDRGLPRSANSPSTARGRCGSMGAPHAPSAISPSARATIAILNAPEREARVESLSGAVTLRADLGDIAITGRVTGVSRSGADPDSRGGVTLLASDAINLIGESADRLTIVFASDGDLHARADRIHNDNARLLANATIDLEASSRIDNVTRVIAPGRPRVEILHRPRGLFSFFFGRPRTVRTSRDFGRAAIPGEIASIAGESIRISAPDIFNSGNIFALDGPAIINAARVHNLAAPSGAFSLVKRCRIVCWSRGFSTADVLGGAISAASGLEITASESIRNDSGSLLALGNMELDAPFISTEARFLPSMMNLPIGLHNLFAGPRAVFAQDPKGGTIVSSGGEVLLRSTLPVRVIAGEIDGSVGVTATAGIIRPENRVPRGGVAAQRIGLFADWLP